MGFVNGSKVRVVEGEEVKVCVKLADVTPSSLQREIILETKTIPGNARGNYKDSVHHTAHHCFFLRE